VASFEVRISGEDLDRAQAALDTAGLGKLGDLVYEVGREGDEQSIEARAVIVEAETAEAAKRQVEEAIPAQGYSVRVKPIPES
jgi:hypothetical protein